MYTENVMEAFRHPKNLKEIPNADGIGKVGNPVCLVSGSMIHTNDKYADITYLKAGDVVLGHNGLYNKIQRTILRNYSGEMIKIKNKLGVTCLTPEHEILAVKVPKRWKYTFANGKKTLPTAWYHAEDLEKGDLIVYPVLQETKDRGFVEFTQKRKKWDFRSKKIPQKIKVDSNFLRLCGYYLAEGHIKDKVTKTYVSFTFNTKEVDLAEDVKKIVKKVFGIEAKEKMLENRKTLVIEVNNVWIVRLFKRLFGNLAMNKKIPNWMMLLPVEKQRSLIYGLWKGDGYVNKKKPRAGYSTISYQLAQQIKTLLLRQKIIPSIYTEEARISQDGVKHKKAYRIHIGERQSLKNLSEILGISLKFTKPEAIKSWFNENYLFIPITQTNKIDYSGKVYNLEIENSRSYLTESLAAHNCGDLLWVYIKVEKNKDGKEIIEDIGVKTFGCIAAIASSSVTTELAKGKTLEEAKKISRDDIIKALGDLPPIKKHCSVLAQDGLHKAIEDYEKKKSQNFNLLK